LPLKKSVGRPPILFGLKGERAQRLQATELANSQINEVLLLVQAESAAACKQGLHDLAAVLRILANTPEKAKQVRKGLTKPSGPPTRASKDEALEFILDRGFTKEQYCAFRDDIRKRKVDIYPIYKDVAEQKQKCRPDNIDISETAAKVSVQDLLVQKKKRSTDADSCLFATTVLLLRLIESSGNLLWINRTPQSIMFCRALKLEFLKETKEVILKERRDIEREIEKTTVMQDTTYGKSICQIQSISYCH